MCGIAGIHRKTNKPLEWLDRFAGELLSGINSRGGDATGYVAIFDNGDIQLQKASCDAAHFNYNRARIAGNARTVLLHTRFATQGHHAFPENNHPVESGGIYAVHNGHIWNDVEVFTATQKPRRGAVDSEAIPAIVAASGWDAMPAPFSELDGAMAAALINAEKPGQLALVKGNDSPLVMVETRDLIVFASTSWAITDAWKRVYGTPPAQNKMSYLTTGSMVFIDRAVKERKHFRVGKTYVSSATASGWSTEDWSVWQEEGKILGRETASQDETEAEQDIDGQGFATRVPAVVLEDGEWTEIQADVTRCEDCGDWHLTEDIETFILLGIRSDLCQECADWARDAELITAPIQKELASGKES